MHEREYPARWAHRSAALTIPFMSHAHAQQPGKCLYTSMRELVENSLDAAESINELPDIDITM
jgi:hypothetical protein